MRAEPKTWGFYGDTVEPKVHTFPNGAVIIECVITDPPSSKGRSIEVYLPPEVAVAVMKDLRSAAITARSQPMSTESNGRDQA